MLLQEFPSLEELVVVTLVDKPGATARELEAAIRARGHTYSLRGIYKELTKLAAQGVVFKTGDSYSIHLAWIMQLLALGDKAFESYTQSPYLVGMLQSGCGPSLFLHFTPYTVDTRCVSGVPTSGSPSRNTSP